MFVETRLGDEGQHLLVVDVDPVDLHLLAQDRDARLEVRRLDVGDQPPLEAAAQPLLERRDVARRPVGREHDLRAGLVQRVEGVEELLLEALLALEELDVVDEQDVVGAVALLEALDPLVAQRVDEVVDEGLARHVAHARAPGVLGDVLRDGLEQVRLAEPRAAVDEERVVRLRRRLGDGERGRVGEAVRRADHERVERVLHVEAAAFGAYRARVGPWEQRLPTPRGPPSTPLRRPRPGARSARSTPTMSRTAAPIRPRKLPLDPVARELARNGEHEGVAVELELVDVTEPLAVRPVAEGLLEPPGDLLPEVLCRQLDLVLHRRPDPPRLRPGGQHNSGFDEGKISACLQGVSRAPESLHRCGQTWGQLAPAASLRRLRLWTRRWTTRGYTDRRAPPPAGIFLAKTSLFTAREAHLPAQRPPPQAQARLPCAHVDEGRPRDPEAPPRQGPGSPLGVAGARH